MLGRLFRWTGNAAEAALHRGPRVDSSERSMLGRDGLGYAFDSGLALLREPEPLAERVLGLVELGMASTSVVRPGCGPGFGCHLLRSLAAVRRLGFERRVDALRELVEQTFDGERFTRAEPGDLRPCPLLRGRGAPHHGGTPGCRPCRCAVVCQDSAAGRQLAGLVGRPESLRPTDSVAQALRIWLLLDSVEFQPAIESAERYLRRCQARSGAMLYTPERGDECSWASIFSFQALTWASEGLPSGAAQDLV